MKRFFVAAGLAFGISVRLWAQGAPTSPSAQPGPDLSGVWNRESVSGAPGAGSTTGWGPRVSIDQSGVKVTVQPVSGPPSRFRTDGAEVPEVLAASGCKMLGRITKAVATPNAVTITTWLVRKSGCFHGESELLTPADPEEELRVPLAVVFGSGRLPGKRELESITVVSRDGNALTVETTRSTPGGAPTTTTTTYRK